MKIRTKMKYKSTSRDSTFISDGKAKAMVLMILLMPSNAFVFISLKSLETRITRSTRAIWGPDLRNDSSFAPMIAIKISKIDTHTMVKSKRFHELLKYWTPWPKIFKIASMINIPVKKRLMYF